MHVFHGTTIESAAAIVANPIVRDFPGLWVTDTAERAARYANARATREVDFDATSLKKHAAILVVEVESARWSVRQHNASKSRATSLDQCEALIRENTALRIVDVQYVECDYVHCQCHKHASSISECVAVS